MKRMENARGNFMFMPQTANGEQRKANGEQRTANSEQRTANGERRTANGYRAQPDKLQFFYEKKLLTLL